MVAQVYKAHYVEAVFPPGMKTAVHFHHGAEASFVVSGIECVETPYGKIVNRAGQGAVVAQHTPMFHCGVRLGLMGVGDASDQPSRLGLAEIQYEVGRYLIGSVLLSSQYRHPQHLEYGMRKFMQAGVEQGAHESVERRDAVRAGLENLNRAISGVSA